MNVVGKQQHNKDLEKLHPKASGSHNTENIFFLMQTQAANLYSLVPFPHNFIFNSSF
jgi:hypothetical protein